MKKFVTVIVVLTLVMGLSMAQAEVRVKHFGEELNSRGKYVKYVTYESDTGEEVRLHVTDEEFDQIIADYFNAKEAKRRAENPTAFDKFVDKITFWN